jgi:hypothetical protein
MIPLNPYRWFVPDPLQFIDNYRESVSLSLAAQIRFSEKQLLKTAYKIIGKSGQYIEQDIKNLWKQEYPFDLEKEIGGMLSRFGHQVRIVGKGAKYVKSAMNGSSDQNFELPGFKCSARCMDDDVFFRKLNDWVYPNLQLFTCVSQQKPKDLPDRCEACGANLSYNASLKKVQPATEIIDLDDEDDEPKEQQTDDHVHQIWMGRCGRCSSEILDWDLNTLHKWFRKMVEFQMKSKKRVFVS